MKKSELRRIIREEIESLKLESKYNEKVDYKKVISLWNKRFSGIDGAEEALEHKIGQYKGIKLSEFHVDGDFSDQYRAKVKAFIRDVKKLINQEGWTAEWSDDGSRYSELEFTIEAT